MIINAVVFSFMWRSEETSVTHALIASLGPAEFKRSLHWQRVSRFGLTALFSVICILAGCRWLDCFTRWQGKGATARVCLRPAVWLRFMAGVCMFWNAGQACPWSLKRVLPAPVLAGA